MKLSIIVPVYNCEKYLEKCLESILQNKDDYEIILVDDGSTDKSSNICDKYSQEYNFIKVQHKFNSGVSSARNYGIRNSSGEYIMFVDADDLLEKNWNDIIFKLKDADIYYYNNIISIKATKSEMLQYIVGNNNANIYLSGPYSKTFKRDFIINNNITFDENIINGEDMLFNIKCLLSTNHYEIINKAFYNYRISNQQATKRFKPTIIESDKRFHESLKKLLNNYKINNSQKKEIISYCKNNAVKTILNRISYIRTYKEAKIYYKFLEENEYKDTIFNNSGIINYLCKNRNYMLLYYIFKIKNIYFGKRKDNNVNFKKI